MRRYAIVLTGAIVSCLTLASAALAEDYSKMAPFDQYMTDRSVEIALAKSAAPPAIADKASVMVLTRKGYETAIKGSNGFVCAVERSWMAQFDFPQFWNPHMRGPLCYNPPAVRSILPYTIKRTELVLAGRTKPEIVAAIRDGIDKHALPHLMFYFPRAEGATWGADLPGAPPMLNPQFQDSPEAISVLMVQATHWSDGTPAPMMHH